MKSSWQFSSVFYFSVFKSDGDNISVFSIHPFLLGIYTAKAHLFLKVSEARLYVLKFSRQ